MKHRTQSGFTIVELLIVIVVIAILAAIVIVAYNGVIDRAKEAGLDADMRNALTQVETAILKGEDPAASVASFLGSGDNEVTYKELSDGYCIEGTSSSGQVKRYMSSVGAFEDEACPVIVEVSTIISASRPRGIAVADDGRVFIAEVNNGRVSVLAADGVTLSTYATGFYGPNGIALGPDGKLYVADSYNHRIQVVSSDGSTVSTYAGSNTTTGGFADGAATTTARFNTPRGVAVGPDGTVYVADYDNHRIRAISTGGTVSTFAGTGSQGSTDGDRLSTARFYRPSGVVVASDGTVYVADDGNHRIRVIATNGTVSTLAGGGGYGYANGIGTNAQFDGPHSIVLSEDESTLYVGDWWNDSVRAIDIATQEVTTLAGNGTSGNVDGLGADARFDQLGGISLDSDGNLYVADHYNNRIRYITIE